MRGWSPRWAARRCPAIGWAAGVERLGMLLAAPPEPPAAIAVVPVGEAAEARAIGLVQVLRHAGLPRRDRLSRQP